VAHIELRNLRKEFGRSVVAVKDLGLTIDDGEFLVMVGPSGCGKTTTLYSVLRHLATPEVNVITIEDPVELIHSPLSQVQVNRRIGFDFAAAIRGGRPPEMSLETAMDDQRIMDQIVASGRVGVRNGDGG